MTGPGGYALGPCTVDVAEFLVLAQQARQALREGRPADAGRDCAAALALWGEPLAEDTYAEWARAPRERLLRARVDVLETAARAALALGDAATAAGYAADAVAADPLRESVAVVHAQALAAAGDRAGALAALDRLRTDCADELGVDPSPEVGAAAAGAAAGEPGAGARRRPRRRAGKPRRRGRSTALAFVGRTAELARLRAAIGAREVVALGGVAGGGQVAARGRG